MVPVDRSSSSATGVAEHPWLFRLPFLAGWSILALALLVGTLASHPVRLPASVKTRMLALLPEGWKFFTRDPQEPQIKLYAVTDGDSWQELHYQNATPTNDFGFSRRGRIFAIGLTSALGRVPASAWVACRQDPIKCGEPLSAMVIALDRARPAEQYLPTDRDLIVYIAKPVPWAWSRSRHEVHMPGRVVRLRLAEDPVR
jgi:sporulation delaying protein A